MIDIEALNKAIVLTQNGYVREAEAIYLKLLSENPNEYLLLSTLGLFYVNVRDFEKAIHKTTQKIVSSLNECLTQAQVSKQDIGLIILTGGSTEIPYVKNTILKMFPNATISEDDKMSSVALGLSYDAMRIYK